MGRGLGLGLAALLAACCPVVVGEEYPELEATLLETPEFDHVCSWGVIAPRRLATAAHCLWDTDGEMRLEERPVHIVFVDDSRDYAEVELDADAPPGARDATGPRRAPSWFEIVCYVPFSGAPNCGRILSSDGDSFSFSAETRLVTEGDSGAVVIARSDRAFLGVVTWKGPLLGKGARPVDHGAGLVTSTSAQ